MDYIKMIRQTMDVCSQGFYPLGEEKKELKLSPDDMKRVRVFLPDALEEMKSYQNFRHGIQLSPCSYSCENTDSYTMAAKVGRKLRPGEKPVLVLNFANAVHPGGGVRMGAAAQEEDLCRKSTLLCSLESKEAEEYYRYNRKLRSNLGSDAIMITPQVEIFRDQNGEFLEDSIVAAVMTCAAPCIIYGLEGLTEQAYEQLFYNRIAGMLRCAACLGYQHLVLGAFGCGAFGNDAALVSDLFYRALKEFNLDGMKEKDMFRSIDFAVLSKRNGGYNFKQFARNFSAGHFNRDTVQEKPSRVVPALLNKIKGSLIGGAIGDALGYPVEFMTREQILQKYGPHGITAFQKDRKSGKALISDDTQMTLFTADGILVGETRACLRGISAAPSEYVSMSYQDWLTTQLETCSAGKNRVRYNGNGGISWLLDVPELYSQRAPGNTCLNALKTRYRQGTKGPYLENPINDRKGCGGIMRVAPLGLHCRNKDPEKLAREGAALAAITHGHSLGYMPAAVLTHILNGLVYRPEISLKEEIREAQQLLPCIFPDDRYIPELNDLIDLAMELAENDRPDPENIEKLGEGWTADETLAIALYCALRHEEDFSAGVTAAVNHSGDSDSTGAVTGQILGAIHGFQALDAKWTEDLELLPVLTEMAEDLCSGCQMKEFGDTRDRYWMLKYVDMHWKSKSACTFFYREYEENGYLSNAYPCRFEVDGVSYLHVEQYLMAQKALLFGDRETYQDILRSTTPAECRKLGHRLENYDPELWREGRMAILQKGLMAKFGQNRDLKEKILATGHNILAQANPGDDVHGIGMTAKEAAELEPCQWKGQNLLGKALMAVRSGLRETHDGETRVSGD